jgi:putative lipoic acid-binding regulatory protein
MSEQIPPRQELQYPCDFPIKVIGDNTEGYAPMVIAILQQHVPELNADAVTSRESSGGKYLSVSATFTAQSREQLDDLYRALTAHPKVRWVL